MANNQFKADVFQVANLKQALSESSAGDLVFRDKFVPQGVRLKDLAAATIDAQAIITLVWDVSAATDVKIADLTTELAAVSGYLEAKIDSLTFLNLIDTPSTYTGSDGYFVMVDGNSLKFVDPAVAIASISGAISCDIINLQTQVTTISGDLNSLTQQVNNLDLTYATDASLAAISGNLQDQIFSNDNDISLLQSQVYALSGAPRDFLGLTDTPPTYSGYDGYLVSVSGSSLIFLDPATIETDTSVIESQIEGLIAISGNHEYRIDILESQAFGISGGIDQLDDRYVNVSGDVMVGDLAIIPLSGAAGNFITVDLDGTLMDSGWNENNLAQTSLIVSLTSNLQSQITTNTDNISNIASISGDWARLSIPNTFTDDNTFTQNVEIGGNLTVQGTTVTVNAETVLIEDNIIEVNSSLSGSPPAFLNAGIKVNRGSEDPYYILWREDDDTFRIGINTTLEPGLSGIGDDTQPVATRNEEDLMTDGDLAVWNGTEKRFDTTSINDAISGSDAVITNPSSSTRNVIQPTLPTVIPLTIKGAASQTANLQSWQDSSGALLTSISNAGNILLTATKSIGYNASTGSGVNFNNGYLEVGSFNASQVFTKHATWRMSNTVDGGNGLFLTPVACNNAAGISHFTLTPGTDGSAVALDASIESSDVIFNLARTVTFGTGALTTQRAFRIHAPTYAFSGASTITNASTLSISGPPVAGTNATITNAYALNVESGNCRFGGNNTVIGEEFVGSFRQGSTYSMTIISNGVNVGPDSGIFFGNSTWATVGRQVGLVFDAPYFATTGYLAQRNGATSQTFRVYKTYTSSSEYERAKIGWNGNILEIGTEAAGTGTVRDIRIVGGDVLVDNNLTVTGDLTVNGTTTTVNTETLLVEDNIIELNSSLSGSPAPDFLISGIKVNRGTDDPYYFLFRESDETFRIGMVSSTEESISGSNDTHAVAAREDNPLDGGIAMWNDTEKLFYTVSADVAISGAINGTVNYISKFTDSSELGNSNITDDGSIVSIKTSAISYTPDIGADELIIHGQGANAGLSIVGGTVSSITKIDFVGLTGASAENHKSLAAYHALDRMQLEYNGKYVIFDLFAGTPRISVPGTETLYLKGGATSLGSTSERIELASASLRKRTGTVSLGQVSGSANYAFDNLVLSNSAGGAYIYNSYTDASNYERGKLVCNSNTIELVSETLGNGVIRPINIRVADPTISPSSGASVTIQGGRYKTSGGVSSGLSSSIILAGSTSTIGGSVTIQGATGSATNQNSGGVSIIAGDVTTNGSFTVGSISLLGGKCNTFGSGSGISGGAITLTTQSGTLGGTGNAGSGGPITVTLGNGSPATGITRNGGSGGFFSIVGGLGGNASGNDGSAGHGSTLSFTAGSGGNATGTSGTRIGGNSGDIIFTIGTPGTGATANGEYGTIQLKGGDVIIDNNLTVGGNLTINGTTTTVNTEIVLVEDNIIELNSSLSGSPPAFLNSGIKVNRGSEDPYYFMWRESDDTFRIGTNSVVEISGAALSGAGDDTQAVATREDSPLPDGIAVWNDSEKRFDTIVNTNTTTTTSAISGVQTTIDSVDISSYDKAVWEIVVIDSNTTTNRYSSTITAIHDGVSNVDFAEYGVLELGTAPDVTTDVDIDSGMMRLLVTTDIDTDVKINRRDI